MISLFKEICVAAVFLALLWAVVIFSAALAQAQANCGPAGCAPPENVDCYKHCTAPIYCLNGQGYSRADQIAKYGQAVGDLCDYAMSTEQELFICEDNLELAYGPKLRRVRKRFKRKLKLAKARCGK